MLLMTAFDRGRVASVVDGAGSRVGSGSVPFTGWEVLPTQLFWASQVNPRAAVPPWTVFGAVLETV